MSTAGLRKVGNYEETSTAAIKDEQHMAGVINPYLANAATRAISLDGPLDHYVFVFLQEQSSIHTMSSFFLL